MSLWDRRFGRMAEAELKRLRTALKAAENELAEHREGEIERHREAAEDWAGSLKAAEEKRKAAEREAYITQGKLTECQFRIGQLNKESDQLTQDLITARLGRDNRHMKPCRCPVCDGRGSVPAGFYEGPNGVGTTATSAEPCRSCSGQGVIYQ